MQGQDPGNRTLPEVMPHKISVSIRQPNFILRKTIFSIHIHCICCPDQFAQGICLRRVSPESMLYKSSVEPSLCSMTFARS